MPPKNIHYAKKIYGIPRETISAWWNGLAYSTKESYRKDLYRLGMTSRDEYQFSVYYFGNLFPATQRAIARLYVEKHGRK